MHCHPSGSDRSLWGGLLKLRGSRLISLPWLSRPVLQGWAAAAQVCIVSFSASSASLPKFNPRSFSTIALPDSPPPDLVTSNSWSPALIRAPDCGVCACSDHTLCSHVFQWSWSCIKTVNFKSCACKCGIPWMFNSYFHLKIESVQNVSPGRFGQWNECGGKAQLGAAVRNVHSCFVLNWRKCKRNMPPVQVSFRAV